MHFIIILIVIGLMYFIITKSVHGLLHKPTNNTQTNESILSCTLCKVHVPESSGIVVHGHFFCREEHARQWSQDQQQRS